MIYRLFMMNFGVLRAPENGDGGSGGGGSAGGGDGAGGGGAAPGGGDAGGGDGGDDAAGSDAAPSPADGADGGGDGGKEGDAAGDADGDAARMAKSYDLDNPDDGGGDDGGDGSGEDYKLEFPEGFQAGDAFTALATPVARELGLDGKKAGAYAAGVVQALQKAEQAEFVKSDAALKKEWGADYRANRAEAQKFYNWCLQESGLSKEDMRVFHSPKGVKLLYALSRRVGEKAQGTARDAGRQSERQWAHEAKTNPEHPDYKALRDVDDARFEEVTQRYNRAMGYGF